MTCGIAASLVRWERSDTVLFAPYPEAEAQTELYDTEEDVVGAGESTRAGGGGVGSGGKGRAVLGAAGGSGTEPVAGMVVTAGKGAGVGAGEGVREGCLEDDDGCRGSER
jgi:hypothetical protein